MSENKTTTTTTTKTKEKKDKSSYTEKKDKSSYKKKKDRDDLEIPKGIDPWKSMPLKKEEVPNRVLYDDSSFATLFPKYKERYIKEIWPLTEELLKDHGIECKLDLIEGSMTVSTTKKCWDPVAILKARDLIKLLSRSVPFIHAKKVMADDFNCDIIKIGGFVRNKDRFVKRRQRLVGPDGSTLKAIELLSKCYVLVQGNTVSSIGSFDGLAIVRKIVEDCMKNVHPIYNIKELMIKRELEKNEELKGESWARFLPQFKKKNINNKKKKTSTSLKKKKDKDASPFGQDQLPRKIDIQMSTGEYFLSEEKKLKKQKEEKLAKQQESEVKRQKERLNSQIAPQEDSSKYQQNLNIEKSQKISKQSIEESISNIKNNLEKNNKRKEINTDHSEFILTKKSKNK